MKKHLIAAAVAGAFALPAMAQNVTLYGNIDTGIAALNGVGAGNTSEVVHADGSIASSVWGFRGSEDLGGGLRAVFDAQSDIVVSSGGFNSNGLFRRAAFAGLAGGFGEVTFGIRINPIIATNGALMPVSGNAVSTLTATALSYQNFFTKNAITYTSPNMGGLVAQVQYGMGNSVSTTATGGSVTAGSLAYTAGPLQLRAAMHDRKGNGTASGANSSNGAVNAAATATADFDATAYVAGIRYKLGALEVAYAMHQNKEAVVAGGPKLERSANQVGFGYQMSPAWLLGGSWTTAEGSTLANAQARYSLSKRTTVYGMLAQSDNNTNGTAAKQVSFLPMAFQTSSHPAGQVDGYAAVAGRKSSAVSFGLIHSF